MLISVVIVFGLKGMKCRFIDVVVCVIEVVGIVLLRKVVVVELFESMLMVVDWVVLSGVKFL